MKPFVILMIIMWLMQFCTIATHNDPNKCAGCCRDNPNDLKMACPNGSGIDAKDIKGWLSATQAQNQKLQAQNTELLAAMENHTKYLAEVEKTMQQKQKEWENIHTEMQNSQATMIRQLEQNYTGLMWVTFILGLILFLLLCINYGNVCGNELRDKKDIDHTQITHTNQATKSFRGEYTLSDSVTTSSLSPAFTLNPSIIKKHFRSSASPFTNPPPTNHRRLSSIKRKKKRHNMNTV